MGKWLVGCVVGSLLLLYGVERGHTQEKRSLKLSASQGKVDPPVIAPGVVALFREDVVGPLLLPSPVGDIRDGRRMLLILRSLVPQRLTFADEPGGYAAQKPAYPLPPCTSGAGQVDRFLFRYDAAQQRWLRRPPSIVPKDIPNVGCLP